MTNPLLADAESRAGGRNASASALDLALSMEPERAGNSHLRLDWSSEASKAWQEAHKLSADADKATSAARKVKSDAGIKAQLDAHETARVAHVKAAKAMSDASMLVNKQEGTKNEGSEARDKAVEHVRMVDSHLRKTKNLRKAAKLAGLKLGDSPGHPFRGNQHVGQSGAPAKTVKEARELAVAAHGSRGAHDKLDLYGWKHQGAGVYSHQDYPGHAIRVTGSLEGSSAVGWEHHTSDGKTVNGQGLEQLGYRLNRISKTGQR